MTAPPAALRKLVYQRDNHQCVACGSDFNITFQHRQASGMGGRGKKAPELTPQDGLCLCIYCNEGAEGRGQENALERGWKVLRNSPVPAGMVPVFYTVHQSWWKLNESGSRSILSATEALDLRHFAGMI